jgi:hypothetical protein
MKAASLFLGFALLFLWNTSQAQDIQKKQLKFVNKFVHAVGSDNMKQILKGLDKSYRKEQLAFLEGNKQQLIDELFGGTEIDNSDVYVNMKINEIEKIEVAEVIQLKGGEGYTYIFRIRGAGHDIYASLRLKKKGHKYGFIGAVG